MQRVDVFRTIEGDLKAHLKALIEKDFRIVQVLQLSAISYLVISEPTGD